MASRELVSGFWRVSLAGVPESTVRRTRGDQVLEAGPEELCGVWGAQGRPALHPVVRTLPLGHV